MDNNINAIRNCSGRTAKGQPCKNKTRDIDGLCIKHKPKINENIAIAFDIIEPIKIEDIFEFIKNDNIVELQPPTNTTNTINITNNLNTFEEKEPDDIEEIRRQIYVLEHPNEPPPPLPIVKPVVMKPVVRIEKIKIKQNTTNPIIKQTETDLHILASHTTCRCCFDEEVKNEDLIRCSNATANNKHLVCKMCLENYVKSMLETATASLCCMFHTIDSNIDNCGGTYSEDNFKHILDDEKFKIFTDCREMQEVSKMAGIIDNYQICPNCNKYGCAIDLPKGKTHIYVNCSRCNIKWCSACRRNDHADKHCYNLIFKPDETMREKVSYIDRMINEISTSKLTHSCIACGTKFYKEEGCNHMTCPKCKTHSCYLCNTKLDPLTPYKHFGNPDGCILWNNELHKNGKTGDIIYNNTRIFVELDKFIEVNDIAIHQMILGRIKMYYKIDTKIEKFKKEDTTNSSNNIRKSTRKIDPYLDGVERTEYINRLEQNRQEYKNGLNKDAFERVKTLQKKYNLI